MLKMPTIHALLNKQYSRTVSATKLTCNRSHTPGLTWGLETLRLAVPGGRTEVPPNPGP